MAGTSRGGVCERRQHPQGQSPQRCQPVREGTTGTIPEGAAARGATTLATKGAACQQGDRQRRVAQRRRQRRSLDEGRRGGLGHPFRKRMIIPLKI
ncbi:hypothetical protein GW17_00060201 [Ensete ventricosum]|nr:hypothetical protein GW17_00060201 [Ensete ventricosum]